MLETAAVRACGRRARAIEEADAPPGACMGRGKGCDAEEADVEGSGQVLRSDAFEEEDLFADVLAPGRMLVNDVELIAGASGKASDKWKIFVIKNQKRTKINLHGCISIYTSRLAWRCSTWSNTIGSKNTQHR